MSLRISLGPGYGLLTAGVGGTAANWRDRFLSRSILTCQNAKISGFHATRSHAELFSNRVGQTFGIRWRTRLRDNGLADYIGSQVTIARLVEPISGQEHAEAWELARMDDLMGRIYPVHRILMMGLTSWFLPGWIDQVHLSAAWAMCSEGVARYYAAVRRLRLGRHGSGYLRALERGWKGIMPAHLEQMFTTGDEFEVVFNGVLTREMLSLSGLPDYLDADGAPIELVEKRLRKGSEWKATRGG